MKLNLEVEVIETLGIGICVGISANEDIFW